MADIDTKGGVEDPDMSAFGIGGEDAPATSSDDVTMAPPGRSPAGTPPPEPTQAEIDAAVADLRGEGAGTDAHGEADPQAEPPPGTNLESDLNAWFDAQKEGGTHEGAGEGPVPPSGPAPAPSSVPPAPDPDAPVPIPILGPDGQPLPPSSPVTDHIGTAPPSVTQPGQISPLEQTFMNTYGRLPSVPELQSMIQVQQDIANMTPQQRQAVESALYGPGPAQTPTPAQDQYGLDDAIDPAIIDQRINARLTPLEQTIQQQQAMLQQQAYDQQQQHEQRLVAEIDAGKAAIVDQYHLTPEDADRFVAVVADTGTFNGLYSKHQNGTEAMKAAMEQALWADPGFRYVQQQRQTNAAQVQQADDSQRRAKAGALAGGSGTVSRDEPVPTTPASRRAGMVAELEQAMNQG